MHGRAVDEIAGHARLVMGLAGVTETRTETRQEQIRLLRWLRLHQPKEGVVLDARLPEALRRPMVGQLEAKRVLVLLKLAGANFDIEIVSLVRYLQYLWPSEAIDAQAIAKHVQPRGGHAHHDVQARLLLGRVQINAVHRQLLGILQVLKLGLLRGESAVLLVQLAHLLVQFGRLVGCETQRTQVAATLVLLACLEVAQLRLGQVRAEYGVRDERARNSPRQNVITNLQANQIACYVLVQLRRIGRIELDLEAKNPRGIYKTSNHLDKFEYI